MGLWVGLGSACGGGTEGQRALFDGSFPGDVVSALHAHQGPRRTMGEMTWQVIAQWPLCSSGELSRKLALTARLLPSDPGG